MKRALLLVLAVIVLLAADGAAIAQATRAQVGMMEVDGKNAFHNQKRVKNRAMIPILDGDYVSTGAKTSVRIGLTADGYGGFIQLDQNTDPNLIIASKCIVMNILKGQALVNAKNICLGTQSISGVTRSLVNIKADGMASQLTVIEGGVDLERPNTTTVTALQRYQVGVDGSSMRYGIDQAEAARTIQWSQNYFTGQRAGRKMPTWLKVALGVAAGAAVYELTDDDDDHRRPPDYSPPSPPSPPSAPPGSTSPEPPESRQPQPQSQPQPSSVTRLPSRVLQGSPVYQQPKAQGCCIPGQATKLLPPRECEAQGGEPCPDVR